MELSRGSHVNVYALKGQHSILKVVEPLLKRGLLFKERIRSKGIVFTSFLQE